MQLVREADMRNKEQLELLNPESLNLVPFNIEPFNLAPLNLSHY